MVYSVPCSAIVLPVYVDGHMMKKKDIVFGISVLASAAVMFLLMHLQGGAVGNRAVIMFNGEVYGTYDLNKNREISVDMESEHNLLCIHSGKIYMKSANCPDGYCVHQGSIGNDGEMIVCLPHKMVVKIESTAESDSDAKQGNAENGGIDALLDFSEVQPDVIAK